MLGKKKIAIFTSFVIFTLAASFMGSFAWFANTVTMAKDSTNINGASMAGYFAYGDGQPYEEDENGKVIHRPYGISIPRHLRNLAWLQYLGNFSSKKYYFELANSVSSTGLDMSTYGVLPPIGTEDNPFISQFNGNGKIITGLQVSNDPSVLFSNDNPHPDIDQNNFDAPQVVGMFGVIGNLDGTDNGASVYNFGLTGAAIYSTTSNALAGILAGYSSGTIANVAVNNSTIDIKNGTHPIVLEGVSNISDYSLIGYTTKKSTISKLSESIYGVNVENIKPFNASTDGLATGWGGSIAIKDIFSRLLDVKQNYAVRASVPINKTTSYNLDGTINGDPTIVSKSTWKDDNNNTYYIREYNENNDDYNEKLGAFQFATERDNIHYLSGGHASTSNYTTGGVPITDGTNFVGVTGNTINNNVKIRNTTSSTEACLWGFEDNKLVTKSGNNTYYLGRYNNSNTDLRLRNSSNALTFYREENDEGFRYTTTINSTKYYLKLSNGSWILDTVPTVGAMPEYVAKPTEIIQRPEGDEPVEPTIWRPTSDPGENSHYYYIYSGDNYLNSNASNTTKTNETSTDAVIWDFGATLSNSATNGTIKNVGTSQNLYLTWESFLGFIKYGHALSNSSSSNSSYSWNTTLNTSTNEGKISNANETGRYVRYNSGWIANDGSANVNIYSVHQAWLDWKKYDDDSPGWSEYKVNKAAWDAYNEFVTKENAYKQQLATEAASYSLVDMSVNSTIGSAVYTYTKTKMDYSEQDVTYFPLNVHEKNENGSLKYEPLETNTGYIIGASEYGSNPSSYSLGDIRISSFYQTSKCITNYSSSTHKLSDVYTIDGSGVHTINDSTQTYEKYSDSKKSVESILKDSETTDSVYGLHFMDAVINKNNCVQAKYAFINGEEYENYEMPTNAIDFNLKEKGYINFFAGTYGNLNGTDQNIDSFFSLHMIQRYTAADNTAGDIPSGKKVGDIKEIYEIEEVLSDNNKRHSYVYRLSNGKYTVPYSFDIGNQSNKYVLDTLYPITDTSHGGYSDGHFHLLDEAPDGYSTLLFKTDWIKNHTITVNSTPHHKAFYFEIPMNEGEFALGSVAGKAYGAYLIYLDIGANAAKTERTQITERFETTTKEFDYPLGVALTTPTLGENNTFVVDATDSVCSTIVDGFSGPTNINRIGNDVTITGITNENSKITPTYKGDSIASINQVNNFTIVPLRQSTVQTKRLQFYDYSVASEELIRTEITDTSKNGGSTFTRTIKQYVVNETNGTELQVAANNVRIYRSTNGAVYTSEEYMDQSDLAIALNNTSVVASFDYSGLNIDYTLYERLKMIYDENNSNGRYYIFNRYIVEVTVTNGEITFVVTSKDGNTVVYINSTELTAYNAQSPQTITVTSS